MDLLGIESLFDGLHQGFVIFIFHGLDDGHQAKLQVVIDFVHTWRIVPLRNGIDKFQYVVQKGGERSLLKCSKVVQ